MNVRQALIGGLLAAAPFMPNRNLNASPKSSAPAAGTVASGVVKKTLPNGMTVLVKEVKSAPVVAVNAWVKVGSVHEEEGEKGLTHFIEHMLFKGTAKMKVGELDRLIKSNGGYNNAHTRYESTDFIDVMPADKFDIALETMADALRNSSFDNAEMLRERQVVLEELHRAQDNPGFEVWNRMAHLTFQKHPYRHPIIGYKDQLLKMDNKLMVDYWKKWYRPQNMVFVVVGDVKASEVHSKVAKAFASWKASGRKSASMPGEDTATQLRSEEATGEHKTTLMAMGFPGPSELDEDTAALDVALGVLGQGMSSRLNLEVREKKKLAQGLSAGQYNGASPGLIYLWADLEPQQVKDALRAMWDEVEKMKNDLVEPEELERQRVRLEHAEADERMSMEGMAGKLGYWECLGDYRFSDKSAQRMRKVTAEDVRRVMRLYFKSERAALVVYRPKESKALNLQPKDWQALLDGEAAMTHAAKPASSALSKSATSGLSIPKPEAEGSATRYRFGNGLTLIVKPARHTPVVAGQLLLRGGTRVDGAAKAGLSHLLARVLLKGAGNFNAKALAQRLDDLGASLTPYSDDDRFGIALQSLVTRFDESLSLLGLIVREATLPEDEIEKERERTLKDIKDKTDSPDEYVADLFNEAFFKGSNYAYPNEGSDKSVRNIKRKDLLELQRKTLSPEGALLTLVGDIAPDKAAMLVAQYLGPQAWPAQGLAYGQPKEKAPQAVARRQKVKLKKKQAHVMLGWPAPAPSSPDYYAARVLNGVMGEGMDSRLFREVRDRRGLCYVVHSFMDRRIEQGAWRIYVGTQPENEAQATQVCLDVAKGIVDKGVTAEELAGAKAYAKGIFQVARQDFGTEARFFANYEWWGLGAKSIDDLGKHIDAVTLEDVARVAKKYLLIDKTTITVVRP